MTDDEILDAIGLLARTEGIFAETAGGVTIATLAKLAASGAIRPDERVVALVTGHGLKTVEALAGAPGSAPTATIAPTLDAFDAALDDHETDRDEEPPDERDRPHPHPAAHPDRGCRRGRGGGATVGEALKALDAAHPGLADRLFDEAGNLRRFVNVFLADEDVRFLDGLATPVARPDALHRPRRRRGLSPGGPGPAPGRSRPADATASPLRPAP